MDLNNKAPKLRIVSGPPGRVEDELNILLETYSAAVWNIGPGPEGPVVTVILLHESVIRQQQLAAARMQAAMHPPARFG